MDSLAISTNDLSRRFGATEALSGLTLQVPRGVVFGFLGPNGSGKTTTIRLLLGLVAPTRGSATVMGHDVSREGNAVRTLTGALLEHTGLYERLGAEDNLDYHARIARLGDSERRARVRELLTEMGLWERRHEPIRTWSRGMKQRLAVARALLPRPPLVFLDEPTAGLDPVAAASLRDDLLATVRRDGTTVFLTTHNLTEAERICERVAVIRKGVLLAAGTTENLRRQVAPASVVTLVGRGLDERVCTLLQGHPDVTALQRVPGGLHLTLRPGAGSASVVAVAVNGGAEVEEVVKPKVSLEDLFLDLVEEDDMASRNTREAVAC